MKYHPIDARPLLRPGGPRRLAPGAMEDYWVRAREICDDYPISVAWIVEYRRFTFKAVALWRRYLPGPLWELAEDLVEEYVEKGLMREPLERILAMVGILKPPPVREGHDPFSVL